MSNETRVLVHAFSVHREDARCDRTHVVRDTIDRSLPLETLFESHATQMTRQLLAETRPGVMVFAPGSAPHRGHDVANGWGRGLRSL
jgi:hypothetical protein